MKNWMPGVLALLLGACEMPDSEGTASNSGPVGGQAGTTMPASATDPSVFTWARIYCTADNESHMTTESVELGEMNFAPPAPPLYIGGGGSVSSTFFGGFEPDWGAGDVEQKTYHPAPAVQWLTILTGSFYVETTDGDSREFRAGDVMHLEDTAPCKGHVSHNTSDEAVFAQFVR